MRRDILHVSHLDPFKAWLKRNGFEFRPGKGEHQVLQIKDKTGRWRGVFRRDSSKEHLTIETHIDTLAIRFISDSKKKTVKQ